MIAAHVSLFRAFAAYRHPQHDRSVRWRDLAVAIEIAFLGWLVCMRFHWCCAIDVTILYCAFIHMYQLNSMDFCIDGTTLTIIKYGAIIDCYISKLTVSAGKTL